MKAIIKVQKGSAYAKFNNQTFEVAELFKTGVSIKGLNPEFPNSKTDFGFNEIIIVDIKREMEIASRLVGYDNDLKIDLEKLQRYCKEHNIKIFTL